MPFIDIFRGMNKRPLTDPYLVDEESIQPAPVNFRQKLKYLGPGFILSASVVGSGELIATTSLGAKAGLNIPLKLALLG